MRCKLLIPTLATLLGLSGAAVADEPERTTQRPPEERPEAEAAVDASLDLNLGIANQYANLRGYVPSENESVQPMARLNLAFRDGGLFTATYWGSFDLQDGERVDNEILLRYQRPVGELGKLGTLTLGAEWNSYQLRFRQPDDSFVPASFLEWAVTAETDHPLRPKIKVAHDYDAGDGTFYELSINPVAMIGKQPVALSVNLLGHDHYGSSFEGIPGIRTEAIVPFKVGEKTTLGLWARHFTSLSDSFDDNAVLTAFINYRFDL